MPAKRDHTVSLWYVALIFLAVLAARDLLRADWSAETVIPYSQFQDMLRGGQLEDVVVSAERITAAVKGAAADAPQKVSTVRVEPGLAELLTQAKVTFSGAPGTGTLGVVLAWLLPTFGLLLFWMLMLRPMSGGGLGGMFAVGKSRAKVFVESEVTVRFDDVAGVDEAKDELKEVVAFLKSPKEYGRLGARIPKGVLLVGPPGTGKTLLARAVAGEAGVPFFSISGSEFVELFVGVGAARVRDLFEQARAEAPAIIFIDELDSLGRARNGLLQGGTHDEKEQTLNQLLAEMDGFDPSSGIVLLAATNRPEILDPALLRAGRFDRQVLVDRPDRKGRVEILAIHLRKVKLDPKVSADEIAAMTPGFTGADLANLVNEAALLATRRDAACVTGDDFTQAVERIVAGLEKRNRLLIPHEREVVAHHEIGHALVSMALPGADRVQKISIIPHGIAALGYTIQRPTEDRFLMDRSELLDRMATLLGGRAAESLVFPEISTGAADDLARATDIARAMVVRYGMDPALGQVAYEPQPPRMLAAPEGMDWQPRHYAEATAAAIDEAIHALVESAFARARAILDANLELLRQAAAELMRKETLAGPDLERIAAAVHPLPEPQAGAVRAV